MDKKTLGMIATTLAVMLVAFLISSKPDTSTMTKSNGVTVISTKLIAKNVKGFGGNTPVKIYISKKKIQKIEPYPNQENPAFFAKAKKLLDKYEGMSVKKALNTEVDGVSGATYSSKALKENVKIGLEYYQEHK